MTPHTYNVDNYQGTAEEILHQLHKGSRAPAKDDTTWMRQAAHRVLVYTGHKVPSGDPDSFIQGLIALDLLHVLKD